MKTTNPVLVVGAGISGIRSALDLAETGHRVVLIDRAPKPGGTLGRLDHQFPDDHCGMCRMLPMVDRDSSSQFCLRKGFLHRNIEIMPATELVDFQGEPGRFQATVRVNPPLVDQQRCIGCGECARVCPVEVRDEFNAGMGLRKAIYLPSPHSIPNLYRVDIASCTQCRRCEEVCPTGAVDLGTNAAGAFRTLVVDDEMIVRESIREWLLEYGFDADTAASGSEALKQLSEQEYGLLLLDVKMPGMDGVEVLKTAREMLPELPVVMMTAYATIEVAVEAMKFGARDYLVKPFDPEIVTNLIKELHLRVKPKRDRVLEVSAVILSTGAGLADPREGADTYGYGELPGVVTNLEFERLLSGSGPTGGKMLRPSDGGEIRKVAWLQCAGSRNIPLNAEYCSSTCCMISIKEALLTKKRSAGTVDTAIFYMDMRTFGKDFQQYRDAATKDHGVRFIRSRPHSVESAGMGSGLSITYVDTGGTMRTEDFDLIVLASGQRPPRGTEELAEKMGIELNQWGFCRVNELHTSRSGREGIFIGGSSSEPRGISDSIIQAGSASLAASELMCAGGGRAGAQEQPGEQPEPEEAALRDVSRRLPCITALICTCDGTIDRVADMATVVETVRNSEYVADVLQVERLCAQEVWDDSLNKLKTGGSGGAGFGTGGSGTGGSGGCNRVLVAACMHHGYGMHPREIASRLGLSPTLVDWVDIRTATLPDEETDKAATSKYISNLLAMGIAKLSQVEPRLPGSVEVIREALVVGGGIAGMTAALAIAGQGFHVALVERSTELGGNLKKLSRALQSFSPRELVEKTITQVERHPKITVYKGALVLRSEGSVGRFSTTIATTGSEDEKTEQVAHGVTILATGGTEARTESYGYGRIKGVVTQLELEEGLDTGSINPADIRTVAMIQCVGSREGERNYCSRVCCASSLKNALYLKEKNPDADIYILYRDMMTYGFMEAYFNRARRAGVLFIQYDIENKPVLEAREDRKVLTGLDPILGRPIALEPDLVVLGTGIVSNETTASLAKSFGVKVDGNGFLREADRKWRPVDSIKEGIFLCGIAHSPRFIDESIAMAEAAAQRALHILSHEKLHCGSIVAEVRHSLCSLCEMCVPACPYGARWKDSEKEIIVVDEAACQGCGACAATCPNGASVLRGCEDGQVLAVIDAAIYNTD